MFSKIMNNIYHALDIPGKQSELSLLDRIDIVNKRLENIRREGDAQNRECEVLFEGTDILVKKLNKNYDTEVRALMKGYMDSCMMIEHALQSRFDDLDMLNENDKDFFDIHLKYLKMRATTILEAFGLVGYDGDGGRLSPDRRSPGAHSPT